MVVVDMAARVSPGIRVVTLDTGRLPDETFSMMELVRERYGVKVEIVSPDPAETERMVTRFGPNLFYESVAMRSPLLPHPESSASRTQATGVRRLRRRAPARAIGSAK